MAKQSGLHQIKGKVEGYSYYRQSGVKDGLMRRINEGLSSRVKTSEEFANTRLNNSEFGNAADVAKVLASVITPKFRPMFLNFSQAKLTKSLLSIIKQTGGDWGKRGVEENEIVVVCDSVNLLAKNDFNALCASLVSSAGESSKQSNLVLTFNADNKSYLEGIGADGVSIKTAFCAIYAGQYSLSEHAYVKSFAKVIHSENTDFALADIPGTSDMAHVADSDPLTGTEKLLISLAILMPYRTINGKNYTLQEKCTFAMIPSVVAQ